MKIPIKSINEIKTPESGVLLFVDQEDSKLKGKKSNNEILNFSSNSNSLMKFYQCTAVDTESKTWSGKELVLTNGIYVVSVSETTGLVYTTVIPIVNNVYTEDGLIKVDTFYTGWEAPVENLVFYAPLKTQNTIAETGQAIEYQGNAYTGFTQEDGIPCIYFGDGDGTFCSIWNDESDHTIVSISFWLKTDNTSNEHTPFTTSRKKDSNSKWLYTNRCSYTDALSYSSMSYSEIDNTKFNHICITRNKSQYSLYVNGALVTTSTDSSNGFGTYLVLHGYHFRTEQLHERAPVYMAAVRVYEKVLTQEEITALANEFTPISEDVPAIPPVPPVDETVVSRPYGYRLKMSCHDLDPVFETEFVQDDLTATGKARTWTRTDNSSSKIIYREDFGGWTEVGMFDWNNYDPIPSRTGFGTKDDPYPCWDETGVAEITVIE